MSLGPGSTFVGDALKVSTNAVVVQQAGVGYDAAGAVVTRTSLPSPLYYVNGIPMDSLGAVFIVDKAVVVAPLQQANGGIQYDSSGALVTVDVSLATPPLSATAMLTFDAAGALVTSP